MATVSGSVEVLVGGESFGYAFKNQSDTDPAKIARDVAKVTVGNPVTVSGNQPLGAYQATTANGSTATVKVWVSPFND